ncbi:MULTISPECIES: phospholipid-binding protein MlaC [Fibrobacter]|uniref:Phospholipid transport system substrate-binding protein n=1 Tax=Fibrobacter intestinalis TaxID=28122 RepID=A0A1M6VP81_9BACT|nr:MULTISPECIES: ABC transporter substrate-binding protein [Fibrobacter]MDD7298122.1 ABC transporter substrate-binding protein [Fibrobacter intestinalis]PBC69518.1 phospholipid transport system substrate-binding protein [Fibrobacter sp. UWS1]SHK83154.1 phospholipid transport system substrate-binding protein [Fibrobacter intestinalis]
MKIQTLLVAVFLPFAVAFAADPVTAISKNDKELQVLLKKQSLSKKDKEKVKGLLSDVFNFNLLAEKSLPKETWNGLDEAAKKQFASEFQRMVRNSSAKRLEMYRTDSTVYEAPKMKKNNTEANVTAHLWYRGKESVLVYKMNLVGDVWMAWDLVIDDLSTARNYKEQFSTILKTKTFAELLEIVKKKADENEE